MQRDQQQVPPSPRLDSQGRVSRTVSFDQDTINRAPPRARRESTGERINSILETARSRAESMGNANSSSTTAAPAPAADGRGYSESRGHDEYSSADEHTGIIMRGPDRNYQTMNTDDGARKGASPRLGGGGGGDDGPRARRSLGSRRSAASSRTELPPPAENLAEDDDDEGRQPANAGRRRDRRRRARQQEKTWHRGLLTHFASIELENKGSVARDHLALERTFLAWLRTSLAFASIGIAVTQLFRLNTSLANTDGPSDEDSGDATLRRLGKPLGATFLAISIVILFLGYHRYFNAQRWIIEGKFPASRGTIIAVAFVAFAVMMASLVVVIVVHPRAREL